MDLTISQLRKIATGPTNDSNMQSIVAGFAAYGARCGLDKPHRLAMYVAQIAHESGDFRYDHEIWGPTPAQARYDTRPDLGNTPAVDGDGKLYMGRTGIQVTGKGNYMRFRDWCRSQGFNCPDFVANPEAIDTDPWEGLAPIHFWVSNGLNSLADTGNFAAVTQRINGGQNGASDRVAFYVRAALVFLGFGPTDVEGFQKGQNLVVDGAAGPMTIKALHAALVALSAAPAKPQVKAVAYIQPAPVLATNATVKASLKAAGSQTINAADIQTKLLGGAASVTAGAGVVSQLSDALQNIPPLAWVILALLLIAGVYFYTHKIVLARIETAITGINTEIPVVRPQGIDAASQPVPEPETPATDVQEPVPAVPDANAGQTALPAQ